MGAKETALANAERLLKQGRVDAAVVELQKLARRNPKDVAVLNRIGDLLARQGRSEEAVGFYDKIAEEFAQSGFIPKAVAIYKKILRLVPERTDTLFQLGNLFLRQELAGEARVYLLRAAELYLAAKEFEQAREVYEQLAAAEPQDARHRVRLAETLAAEGKTADAATALVDVGRALLRDEDSEQAEQAFRRASELAPAEPGAIVGIASCLNARGESQQALSHLEEHTGKGDPDPVLAGQVALFLHHSGHGDRALDQLFGPAANEIPDEIYVEIFRGHLGEDAVEPLWQRFDPLIDQRAGEKSADGLVKLLERLAELEDSGHVPALERIARVYEAREDSTALPEALETLLRAYDARGMQDEAGKTRNRLREVKPMSPLLAVDAPADLQAAVTPSAPAPQEPAPAKVDGATPSAETTASAPDTSQAEAPAVPLNRTDEEFVTGRVTQAEILEKYGLHDQAREQLREVTERFPGHVETQQRYVKLLQAGGAIGELRDALVALALARRAAGDADGAREAVRQAKQQAPLEAATKALLIDLGLEGPARPATPSAAPAAGGEVVIDFDFDAGDAPAAPAVEAEASEPSPAEAPAPAEPEAESVLSVPEADDDDDLSAITAALEDQLFEIPDEPLVTQPESEESLEDVFAAFRRHVEEEVGEEDHRTHYDLGIAYKEMGLLSEAIEEFRLSSEAPDLKRDSISMLALCHRENGDLVQAARWYREALGTDGDGDEDATARSLRYDLAEVLLQSGDAAGALDLFRNVLKSDPSFRDVQTRVSELEARLGP
jgi:tetratricopeptide (TPR) repeat protein